MLHGLESALGTCGVTVLGRASAAEIAGVVRTAFDPAAAARSTASWPGRAAHSRSRSWAGPTPGRSARKKSPAATGTTAASA